jgi:hypothetical protein
MKHEVSMLLSFLLSLVLATDDPNAGGGDGTDTAGSAATEAGSGSIAPAPGSAATTPGSFSVVASAVGAGSGSLSGSMPTPSASLPASVPSQVPPAPTSVPSAPKSYVAKIPIYPSNTPNSQDLAYAEEERADEPSGQVIGRAKCTQCKSFRGKWLCKSCVKRISKPKHTKKKHRKKVRCVMQNGKKICGKALD